MADQKLSDILKDMRDKLVIERQIKNDRFINIVYPALRKYLIKCYIKNLNINKTLYFCELCDIPYRYNSTLYVMWLCLSEISISFTDKKDIDYIMMSLKTLLERDGMNVKLIRWAGGGDIEQIHIEYKE